MSDYRYKFVVSLGYADHEVEYDLVDDLGYAEEALSDESYLQDVLLGTLRNEESNHIESWWEKI